MGASDVFWSREGAFEDALRKLDAELARARPPRSTWVPARWGGLADSIGEAAAHAARHGYGEDR